jgi:predicted RND superfamily exporter protein
MTKVIMHDTIVKSPPDGTLGSARFSSGFIGRCAYYIFHWRLPILLLGIVLTVLLGWSATRLQVTAGFSKMIPRNHEFMQTFRDYQSDFGGANNVLLAIKVRKGDIYNKEVLQTVKKITDEVFYIKGVERSSLLSISTPNARYNEVVEEGFKSGNLMPGDFVGRPDQVALVRENVMKSDLVGRIVSSDMTATMVVATLQDLDPETGQRLDLRSIGSQLERIRTKYEDERVSVHIIGFAKSIADVADGVANVMWFFVGAFFITAALLYWYSGSAMLTAWTLVAAAVPVVWLMGLLPLMGLGLDPLSILVPFLIFSIGVSHAVQMTSAWKLETLHGADGVTASRNCFMKLFVPGATALLANALGFMVIAVVDIEIVRELAITATIGVTVMIITNKVLLPILLSYMRISLEAAQKMRGKETAGDWVWSRLGFLATRRGALLPLGISALLTVGALYETRDLLIGDASKGVPELHADSRYNKDVELITNHFAIGVDLLQVVAEAKGDASPCVSREVQDKLEKFDLEMRQVPGVAAVRSLASFSTAVTQDFAEGWVKWHMLPETKEQIAQAVGFSTRFGNEYRNSKCNAMPVSIYTTDHKATTIAAVVDQVRRFKAANDTPNLKFRLASGNVGVMAATNEVVQRADFIVNVTLFSAVTLLCLITFRSIAITLCIVIPLAMVTLMCNAVMAMLGIGVKVNTLPVIAISVGVGVDYGIYLFERIRHEMHERGATLQKAFVEALKQRGSASLFTAVTMTVSVATWVFSPLKFQSDMGLLLAFMFLINVFAAILVLPAVAAYLVRPVKAKT